MTLPHPWRRFRELTGWTLTIAPLPGQVVGLTSYATCTVTMHPNLPQATRRSVIAHECVHIEHPDWSETTVRKAVARELIPDLEYLGKALAWASTLDEAADELWVALDVLEDRLRWLHPSERGWLRERLG